MQLNSNGKLAKFYLWFSDGELPRDFCSYFWGLVRSVICSLIVLVVVGVLLWAVGFALYHASLWVWAHKIGVSVLLVITGVLTLAMWLSERRAKIEVLTEVKAVVAGKVDAIKNRYCPRIEWK